MKRGLKISVIILGAVFLTTLGIDAADTLSGSRSTMLGQLISLSGSNCPVGMNELPAATTFTCIDIYEAAASSGCVHAEPNSIFDTSENMMHTECAVVSEAGRQPWRFVSRDEAETLCLRSDKRLPTNAEWQRISLGTIATTCNVSSGSLSETGAFQSCVSAAGVYDAVGNVWEWTSEDVVDGAFNGRTLPTAGYVHLADSHGMAVETSDTPDERYGADYFWSGQQAVSAIMRGGFYGSNSDAGVYAAHADIPLDFIGEAIGFRCVR